MSKQTRSIERNNLRKQYERFAQAWRNEKRYQEYLESTGQQLPEGTHRLGRKPTFRMWLDAVNNKKIAAATGAPPAPEQSKAVEVSDTEWDEEKQSEPYVPTCDTSNR